MLLLNWPSATRQSQEKSLQLFLRRPPVVLVTGITWLGYIKWTQWLSVPLFVISKQCIVRYAPRRLEIAGGQKQMGSQAGRQIALISLVQIGSIFLSICGAALEATTCLGAQASLLPLGSGYLQYRLYGVLRHRSSEAMLRGVKRQELSSPFRELSLPFYWLFSCLQPLFSNLYKAQELRLLFQGQARLLLPQSI